jgi:hypothetical protein
MAIVQQQAQQPSRTGPAIGFIGAAVVLAGSFMAWATASGPGFDLSVSGTSDGRDGIYTAIGALILIALFAVCMMKGSRGLRIAALIVSLLIITLSAYDIADISNVGADGGLAGLITFQVGIGLKMVLAGAIAATVGAVISLITAAAARAAAAPSGPLAGAPSGQPIGQAFPGATQPVPPAPPQPPGPPASPQPPGTPPNPGT